MACKDKEPVEDPKSKASTGVPAVKVDTNRWLIENGYKADPRFTQIARLAASLAREGKTLTEIQHAIGHAFPPPEKISLPAGTQDRLAPFTLFQSEKIKFDPGTLGQFNQAMALKPVIGGALMPDGHYGYGVPIGSVVVAHNAIFPAFVGADIYCRMRLTIPDISVEDFMKERAWFLEKMKASSRFGPSGYAPGEQLDHPAMEDPRWREIAAIAPLYDVARSRLGTSGGGNHFFNAVLIEVARPLPWLPGARPGDRLVGFMSHSGSRKYGNDVCSAYAKRADRETAAKYSEVPEGYGWLDLDSESGQEYYQAMDLGGVYAKANHDLIHQGLLTRTGLTARAVIENPHNFAELMPDGSVIHRKEATPAGVGQYGIVPGSCLGTSFVTEGLGNPTSYSSSSHGAGRAMSRESAKKAQRLAGRDVFEQAMRDADILHTGIPDDQTNLSYKDPESVMEIQDGVVVNVAARMHNVITIMGEEDKNEGK